MNDPDCQNDHNNECDSTYLCISKTANCKTHSLVYDSSGGNETRQTLGRRVKLDPQRPMIGQMKPNVFVEFPIGLVLA